MRYPCVMVSIQGNGTQVVAYVGLHTLHESCVPHT